MGDAVANNARVTNAVLGAKLDGVKDTLTDFITEQRECNKEFRSDIGELNIEQGKQGERLKFRTWAHGIAESVAIGLGILGQVN